MTDLETFRRETRAWLEANCPPEMRTPPEDDEDRCWGGRNWKFKNEAQKQWLERMAARGWTVPDWPKEYGGGGLSKDETKILREEMRALKCRSPLDSFGIWMLGPALLKYGAEAQKKEHLPRIARGEIRWCQGYSEPGAGSDLASLQTKAEDKGDHYLVNGQKIWTSYANYADWIFCLVRTDPKAKKHEGISFLLFDMATPGVTTRPILLISGKSPFCETFFTDVKVPKDQLVGPLNGGWSIAKRLLQFERQSLSGAGGGTAGGTARFGAPDLERMVDKYVGRDAAGRVADADLRQRLIAHHMEARAFALTLSRAAAEAKSGSGPSAATSIMKNVGAKIAQDRAELSMEMMGHQGLGWEGEGFNAYELGMVRGWLGGKAVTIYGGSTEIQNNIVAKRMLGLLDHQ
jgi:alkylation response protein AidB-like acyl-CoA dehydrogenase